MDRNEYAKTARQASAEGSVLLKNENGALPLKAGEKIAVFGRIQFHYYKSGTGSGGMVYTAYETNIPDALKEQGIQIDKLLEDVYRKWLSTHPFERTYDKKNFWITEPWAQEEMPLSAETVQEAALRNDAAVVIIGRTAGEEKDFSPEKGSYYLSDTEMDMLLKVSRSFQKTVVILNTANLIDLSWMEPCDIDAVLCVWQGGMEGGNGAADVLTGRTNPCGKLSDTIACHLTDYPAHKNYGGKAQNRYQEDVYVGYRFFETFAPDSVRYPFGFGLSYTTFRIQPAAFAFHSSQVTVDVEVQNTGSMCGREVVQLYVRKPQKALGNPHRILTAFEKTGLLMPQEKQDISFTIPVTELASYDDSGATGHKSAYVLESGSYQFYVGNNVRDAVFAGRFENRNTMVAVQLRETLSPAESFTRMKALPSLSDSDETPASLSYEPVPRRTTLTKQMAVNHPAYIPYQGNQGYILSDVKNGQITMETFLSQLTDEELACLIRGEGMRSPKVTPGTASAFGGITPALRRYGIPAACCADGPSGIRRDDGHQAFCLPNGTALGCTFDPLLIEKLFTFVGQELLENRIDILLAPGMNIHRYPLNGRNFEYFSEDPLLTGKMAAAEMRGIRKSGVSGTLKHFAVNNQETYRTECNAVVSERALREIYLKGFQIAVEESDPLAVMSTYGPVNGTQTAGNYELLTTILREEWGYGGMVMTDWEAKINDGTEEASVQNTAAMIRAQNDVYMVVTDAETNSNDDNTLESLENGKITRGELVRNANNICRVIMNLPVGSSL